MFEFYKRISCESFRSFKEVLYINKQEALNFIKEEISVV